VGDGCRCERCNEKYVDGFHAAHGTREQARTRLSGRPKSAKVRKAPPSPAYDADVRVLVVEDEDAIAEPLAEGLRREGFEVERVATGGEALEAPEPDVVLLDLRLPDLDGFEVCRQLRARSDVPIIVVSARGEEVDRVVGLELGADDYVVKPFGLRELIARIRAVSRRSRSRGDAASVIAVGALRIDPRSRRVSLDGSEVQLTAKEFDLLALLARDPGVVVDRERILRDVWHTTWYGSSKTIDVHVAALRKKLGDPAWIETVRGVGLRLRAA
jgi:two-component system, OmpR family, response regulator RegX3